MVVALPDGRKADAVARALIEQMGCLPVHLRRSLTWDRGLEMAHHAAITAALSMPVFFCDPHHPWQLAARHQREHQPAAAPISAQER
jgi:IS30 family transposase